jgi:hypothetical protein
MEGGICLADPQMRVILYKGVAVIQKVEHGEQPEFADFLNLFYAHDLRVLGSYVPEQSEFDDS